jgi:hypothetical protein
LLQRLDASLAQLWHQPHNNALQNAKQQVLIQVRITQDIQQTLRLLDEFLLPRIGGPRTRRRCSKVPRRNPRREHVDNGLGAATLDGHDLLGSGDLAWGCEGVVWEQGGAYGAEQVWDVRGSEERRSDVVR